MRFLLLSLEFNAGTFSGNGVYACSQARALTQLEHEVLVVAGAPPGHAASAADAADLAQRVVHVELPVWGRLDASCAWREFAAGAGGGAAAAAAAAFQPHAVLGVDWHSVGAYQALAGALGGRLPPFVYLNYRVYHRTASPGEQEMIEGQEAEALRLAACSLVLSRADAAYLRQHFPADAASAPLHVLLPALRADMEALPPPLDAQGQHAAPGSAAAGATAAKGSSGSTCAVNAVAGSAAAPALPPPRLQSAAGPQQVEPPQLAETGRRRYLACCVRLSPEKEPHRFVALIEELQRRGALQRLGVVPLMAGAGWASEYGTALRRRVEQHVPQCVIHNTFLGPAELAGVYAATLLNLHPPTYDAYGMTIVEAASQGAPSLVQGGGHVGATDLLSEAQGQVLCCDMDAPVGQLADTVEALLSDRVALAAVGRAALAQARSWAQHDNAQALVGHVQQALAAATAAT